MTHPLNLPFLPALAECQNILVAGAGGGFDVYAGLPIYHQLRALGKTVHLANYSFVDTRLAPAISNCEVLIPQLLVGTHGNLAMDVNYFPEAYLAQGIRKHEGYTQPVWLIQKVGVPGVLAAYQTLVQHLQLDAIILVDGGVDSLMFGDEQGAGTFVEDTVSLTAVTMLGDAVKVKIIAAIGMGAEVEEGVSHHAALQNMATLIKDGAYYGACALTPDMPAFQFYERIARYSFEAENHDRSRIQTRLIPSVWGEFGAYNWYNDPRQPDVFHSPLMSIYWCFEVEKVNARSLLAPLIRGMDTFRQAMQVAMTVRSSVREPRPWRSVPL